ncbi:MAG: tetratricopeptide repeat protein [Balneolaceae bacterium]
MNKLLYIFLISVLLAGCAGPLKQNWQNFTAYYNTFYNARQFYAAGLEKNTAQIPDINPLVPIRVHVSPTRAGLEDFSNAIERGASILRNHENSKYVTQALALIGKSYYYRSEFFAALEKFQELQAIGNSEEIQQAVLWQGRVYMEMDAISEGIRFLETEIEQTDDWVPHILAEAEIILAQLYVEQQNPDMALNYLSNSISDTEDGNIAARAYFLQGQLFEEIEKYEQALYSYSRIQELKTSYNLEFNALRKEAEVLRKLGNYSRAQALYSQMARDDKYIDYRNDLNYEIARTYQDRGDAGHSLTRYTQILSGRFQQISNIVRAKTYFGIAEIYRDHFDDFSMAAAYFDSAANVQADPSLLPENFNARELAVSFGEYASVKEEISGLENLLHLGSLSSEELDSVLVEMEKERALERSEERRRNQNIEDQLVLVNEPSDSMIDASENTGDGFLSIRNPQRVNDASLQFQAVWGDRPLADNWRRRSELSGSRHSEPIVLTDGNSEEILAIPGEDEWQAEVIFNEIPYNEDEKNDMTARVEELNYRLANIFFLSLGMPDSAKVYYRQVADSSSQSNLVTRSLYSLAEIELSEGNRNEALKWSEVLMENYPASHYTQRIAERLEIPHSVQTDEAVSVEERYLQILSSGDPAGNAAELQQLAEEEEHSESRKAYILFEAAKEYMKAARHADGSTGRPLQVNNFKGAYWDSTRSVLGQIETQHASSGVMPRVRLIQETLQQHDINPDEQEEEIIAQTDREEALTAVPPCEEMEPPVEISGGMSIFLENLTFPDWTRDIAMRGEIIYSFAILPDGSVESYELVSRMDRTGIPQSYERAIENHLNFEPTRRDTLVKCSVTFPVNL